jgi:CRISPR-associated protein Cmr5
MSEKSSAGTQTLDQKRAKHAWEAVRNLGKPNGQERKYGEEAKTYGREAKKLPTRIMAAGLGQALAFLAAKSASEKKHSLSLLLRDLTKWVIEQRSLGSRRQESLLENILEGDADFLRRATDETLSYLVWLNRFAESEGLTKET